MYKLRLHGLNAVFGLKIQFSIGHNIITAIATGTAVYLKSLPLPQALKVERNLDVVDEEDKTLLEIQKKMMLLSETNRALIEKELLNQPRRDISMLSRIELDQDNVSSADDSSESDNDDGIFENSNGGVLDASTSALPSASAQNAQKSLIIQIDDEHDEDILLLLDTAFPESYQFINSQSTAKISPLLDANRNASNMLITVLKCGSIGTLTHHPNRQLSSIFRSLYQDVIEQISVFEKCVVSGINYDVQVIDDYSILIRLDAVAVGHFHQDLRRKSSSVESLNTLVAATNTTGVLLSENSPFDGLEEEIKANIHRRSVDSLRNPFNLSINATGGITSFFPRAKTLFREKTQASEVIETASNSLESLSSNEDDELLFDEDDAQDDMKGDRSQELMLAPSREPSTLDIQEHSDIPITSLSFLPNASIEKILGRVSLHFVKESNINYENGTGLYGVAGFKHVLLTELYAMARGYAKTLGGNALVSFSIDLSFFEESVKNQGYALISISADVVQIRPLK